jgi:inhibitor of KinA sporulation pathway (predicted exonuclease)
MQMNFYLDFEATRFSNRIISIGCTNEKGATFKTLVKPNKGKVDKFITELTGITREMLEDAPSPDEAFNAFAEWAYVNSENTAPKYFCYGDSDKDFIAATMRTMSDFKAISFAASVKDLLIDYAPEVANYLCYGKVALKKVVALIEDVDEVEQSHDALEDAEMLRKVVENLQTKCTPADAEKLATMKSAPRPGRKKAPEIFVNWPNKPNDRFKANTFADETNYIIKCESSDGIKYFDNIDTATLWVIKYLIKGKSPKKASDMDSIRHKIKMAIKNNRQSYCGFKWEEKTIQND